MVNGELQDFILDYIQDDSVNIGSNGFTVQGKKMFKYDKNIKFRYTDETVTYVLNCLPSCYLDDYMKWLTITNVLKGLKLKVLWESWSMQSSNYNEYNNNKIWNGIKDIKYDLNYLIYIINKETTEKICYFDTYKEFKPLQFNYNPLYANDYRVTNIFNFEDFKHSKTTVIQSCTGTGKTTAIAKHMKEYISNDDTNVYKVLSIIDKITLGAQHLESFKTEEIQLRSYHDGFKRNEHYYVCINSLLQLENLKSEDFGQYVVFIDEINSFLQFTHNTTLTTNLKRIYNLLLRIIKNAHKVIVSDNMICDNVFELLEVRGDDNIKFIINEFQKFEGVEAYKIRDANSYLELLKKHIENKKYFLFGCDSAEVVVDYYNLLIKDVTEEDVKNNFILITAKHPFEIGNASETFLNKFVFYSPSITTAVDFSIHQAQDVFIYIKGSSIDACSSFQLAARCRNIKKLFYYAESKSKEAEYESLEELRNLYTSYILQSEKLKDICEELDDEYNVVINEDKFFNMFTYNEYNADIFKTNRCVHFENILKIAKFKLCTIINDDNKVLNKEVKLEMTEATKEQKEKLFNEFVEAENVNLNKFTPIVERMEFLNLPNDKTIIQKYKDVLTDDKTLEHHLNLIRMLKTDEYINNKLSKIDGETFKVKTIDTVYNKIHIIRNFEKSFNLKPLQVDYKTLEPIEINPFRTTDF